jgi:ABC-type multidrug transport system fused ATPase/permease subunit
MKKFVRKKIGETIIFRALKLLSAKDKEKLLIVVVLQLISAVLDLIGVALVGVLGVLVVAGFGAGVKGDRIIMILRWLNIEEYDFRIQVSVIAILVTTVLALRTIATTVITRRTLYFLSVKAAEMSADLISRLLQQSYLAVKKMSTQETLFSVTYGVQIIILGIVGTAITTLADLMVLVILVVGLFFVNPIVALSTSMLFVSLGFTLYVFMSGKAKIIGKEHARLLISSDEAISNALNSFKEIYVRHRIGYLSQEIRSIQLDLSKTTAAMQFMPQRSKYVFEFSMVIGVLLVSALLFIFQDATIAFATLGIFLVSGVRISPAVLRIQQGATLLKSNISVASPTLELIDLLAPLPKPRFDKSSIDTKYLGFNADIELQNVQFKYPNTEKEIITDLSLKINPGQKIAIIGPSGSGKTTLLDLMIGILPVDSGTVLISGNSPFTSIQNWPGSIGYVPQDVFLRQGSIRENITLGYPDNSFMGEEIWRALELAHLGDFVKELPNGLDSHVGEHGFNFSGGQKQRIGIARALITKPKLLFLDEATSALDGNTDSKIINNLFMEQNDMTVVIIAHRLSTIKKADNIFYFENGKIVASGDFEMLKKILPKFESLAELS